MRTRSLCDLADLLILVTCTLLFSCKPGEKAAAVPKEAAAAVATTDADAFMVLPGDYAQSTTVDDLEARFGAVNVRRESGPEPRIVLFPDDPTRRASVTFHEAEDFKELACISVTDRGSRWRGKHSVHVGMSLAKLRELNGKPFYFQGFDEQGRGQAHDSWSPALSDNDATLGAFDVSEGEHLYLNIELGVVHPPPQNPMPALPVDERLSSDDPRFPALGDSIMVTGIRACSSLDDEWE